ncbi:hypothetical protein V5O48_006651 [Marasmius crinis-equi]|uniref:F-box domain-containing protein n=1 Tax=Marasmius crinis-equi TaxID=585013 RepID=A0ABR3FJI1_9AGAR
MPTATELPVEIIAEISLRCPYDIRVRENTVDSVSSVSALARGAPSLNVLATRSKPKSEAFEVEEAEAVPVPSFTWEGMTHLEMGGFYGRQYSEILYQCMKLHTLVIDDLNSSSRECREIPTIRLETIRRLRLSLYNRWTGRRKESKAFCEAMVLPGLKELEVVRSVNTAMDFDSLGGLVRRSGCELSLVSIRDISIMDVAVGEFFRTMPEVASLTVKGRFSRALTIHGTSQGLQ